MDQNEIDRLIAQGEDSGKKTEDDNSYNIEKNKKNINPVK